LLKGRLGLVYKKTIQYSKSSEIICDIGTDHGYIPIELISNGICKKVIASDIKTGPLKVCLKNAVKAQVENNIELRIGNGLEVINNEELETIVIAGMGGELIAKILDYEFEKTKIVKSFILQPMNDIDFLRNFLYTKGLDIYDEELCREEEKIYNVICARYDGIIRIKPILETYIGELLIKKNDPLLKKLLQKKIKSLKKIVSGLEKSKNANDLYISSTKLLIKDLEEIQ
jgi:tRNA (adenine22-N1)-methyltransferase